MRLGVYGGTFDPPHLGHALAARDALRELRLQRLLVIPDNTPPHKALADGSPDARERLTLTRATFTELPEVEVSELELRRGGRSYTVETLETLRAQYPEDELVLLLGTDMLLSFQRWWRWQEILSMATLGVFTRAEGEEPQLARAAEQLRQEYGARVETVRRQPLEISSTALRAMLPRREGCGYLAPEAYRRVIRLRLYGAKPQLDWLRRDAGARQAPERAAHVAGCEAEAARLAARWGWDQDDAREAAILHDLTKKYGLLEQLKLCDEYGIMCDTAERQDANLLHAMTSAAAARALYGVSEEIASAIRWHTTGRENMTLPEKILCLADFIEPTRHFADLTRIRRLAYTDLDGALLLSFQMTLESLRRRGITPHENTLRAAAWLGRDKTQG